MDLLELTDGVRLLSAALRGKAIPHAFGGAIAYGLYGIPRSTNDWDINIFLPEARAAEVFETLLPLGIEVTPKSYQEVAKSGQVRLSWGDKKVDLFFAYADFHKVVEERTREAPFEDIPIWVLTGEDIVVFKVIFNRPHDWRDLERLFAVTPYGIDLDYANHWLTQMLGADDSRITHLAEVVASSRELMEE